MKMASEENCNYDCEKGSEKDKNQGVDENKPHETGYQKQPENLERESQGDISPKVDSFMIDNTASFGLESQFHQVSKSEYPIAQTGKGDLTDGEQVKTKTELKSFSDVDEGDIPQILHVDEGDIPQILHVNEGDIPQILDANVNSEKGRSAPPMSLNCAVERLVNDDKDNYQEITSSEVSSLDDWEHLHKSCLMEIPPVDPGALHEIEKQAKLVAAKLDHMLGTLASHLNAVTKIDTQALAAYNSSIDHVNSTVDKSIKGMYTLISKCEELNSSMEPVAKMAAQIKEIKKALDIFESMCK